MAIKIDVGATYNDQDIKRAQRDLQTLADAAGGASKSFSERFADMGKSMETFGKEMTTKVTLPIVAAGAGMFAAFTKQEDAEAKLNAVLKATGGVAGVTADHVKDLAASLQETTTFGDEATIAGASLLLTFKNISNAAGEGNDVFDRTIRAVQDLSALTGQDLSSGMAQFGKALNDPTEGISRLTRANVNFTEEQKEQIKILEESGDVLGAQKIMLGEIESQFGGLAQEMAQTSSGQIKQAMNSLGDSMEQFGAVMAPAIGKVVDKISEFAKFLQNLSPAQKEWAVRIAAVAAAIGPLLIVTGKLMQGVSGLIKVVKGLGIALKFLAMNPVGLIVVAIAALVAGVIYAYNNFEWFRDGVQAVWEAIQKAVQFAWENVIKPIWDLISWYIENVLVRYIKILWTVYSTVFKAVAEVVKWAWNSVIKPVWENIQRVISGVLVPIFQTLLSVARSVWNGIVSAIQTAWNGISTVFGWIKSGFDTVVGFFRSAVGTIGSVFSSIGGAISSPFKAAFNFVVRAWNNTVGKLDFTLPTNPLLGPLSGFRVALPKLEEFNKGGMVPGIPGAPQLAILHGGERVLRRSEVSGYDGGGDTYNITINGMVGRDKRDILDFLARELPKQAALTGRAFG